LFKSCDFREGKLFNCNRVLPNHIGVNIMHGIKDKTVLITGASSGIGEASARLLAQKGARVVLGARRTERLKAVTEAIRSEGGEAEFRALDVTSLEYMEAFAKFALESHGRIGILRSSRNSSRPGVFQLSSGRRSCSAGRRPVTFPRSAPPMDAHKAVIA
jgi:short chain dehydrogenase